MRIKSFIITAGLGAVAGAAALLMMPKYSKVYQTADDAAQMIKTEAGRIIHDMNN